MNNETDNNTDLESTRSTKLPEPTVSTSNSIPVKQKNPKRVEAGRKGAAARWAKREAEAAKIAVENAKIETTTAKTEIEPSEITKDEPEIKQEPASLPTNYKNYFIPIGIVALAAGFYFISMRPKKEVKEKHINPSTMTDIKKVYDPFDD